MIQDAINHNQNQYVAIIIQDKTLEELCREYMNVFFSQLNFCVEDAKEIATSWLAETQVFNYEKNPLMLWIQGMSDHNITISEDNCRAIQSLYANNVISAEHLKNAQHIANIMYNKTLYKYNKNDIEFIVKTFKFFDPANKILIDKHLFNEEYAKEQGILEYTDKKNNKAFSINYEKLRIFVLFDSPDLKNNNLNVIDSVKNLVINNTQKIKDILNLLEKDDSNLGLNLSERKYNKQGKLISTPSNNAQINTNLTNKVKSDYNDIINKLNIKWEEIPQFASYLMAQYANKS